MNLSFLSVCPVGVTWSLAPPETSLFPFMLARRISLHAPAPAPVYTLPVVCLLKDTHNTLHVSSLDNTASAWHRTVSRVWNIAQTTPDAAS